LAARSVVDSEKDDRGMFVGEAGKNKLGLYRKEYPGHA
jgi:hypothetical protein